MNKKERLLEKFVLLLVISSFFFPTINLGIEFRIDDLLALLIIPIFFFVKPKIRASRLNFTYILIIFMVIFSTLHGYFILKVPPSFRDFNEIIRIIKPFLIIILVDYCNENVLTKYLDIFFKTGALFIIMVGFLEYFDLFNFRSILAEIYSTEGSRYDDIDRKRIIITSGDPNIAAALILYFSTYITQSLFFRKAVSIKLFYLFLLLVVLLMTSSRTLLIIFIVMILSSLIYHSRKKKLLSIAIFSVCLITLVSFVQFFDYLTIGFSTFQSGENTSMIIRYQLWTDALNLFSQSPFFGWGPAKAIHTTIVDGEHFMLLRRYGIIGYLLIIYLLLGYSLVFLKNKKKISYVGGRIEMLAFTSFFTCLVIFVIMITNNFFSGYQLMPLYVVMITLVEKKIKNIK